jgi:hypothetical protein
VHLLGLGFLLLVLGGLAALRYLSVYPLPALRARFIADPVPRRVLRLILFLRLPLVGLAWIVALLWFRAVVRPLGDAGTDPGVSGAEGGSTQARSALYAMNRVGAVTRSA